MALSREFSVSAGIANLVSLDAGNQMSFNIQGRFLTDDKPFSRVLGVPNEFNMFSENPHSLLLAANGLTYGTVGGTASGDEMHMLAKAPIFTLMSFCNIVDSQYPGGVGNYGKYLPFETRPSTWGAAAPVSPAGAANDIFFKPLFAPVNDRPLLEFDRYQNFVGELKTTADLSDQVLNIASGFGFKFGDQPDGSKHTHGVNSATDTLRPFLRHCSNFLFTISDRSHMDQTEWLFGAHKPDPNDFPGGWLPVPGYSDTGVELFHFSDTVLWPNAHQVLPNNIINEGKLYWGSSVEGVRKDNLILLAILNIAKHENQHPDIIHKIFTLWRFATLKFRKELFDAPDNASPFIFGTEDITLTAQNINFDQEKNMLGYGVPQASGAGYGVMNSNTPIIVAASQNDVDGDIDDAYINPLGQDYVIIGGEFEAAVENLLYDISKAVAEMIGNDLMSADFEPVANTAPTWVGEDWAAGLGETPPMGTDAMHPPLKGAMGAGGADKSPLLGYHAGEKYPQKTYGENTNIPNVNANYNLVMTTKITADPDQPVEGIQFGDGFTPTPGKAQSPLFWEHFDLPTRGVDVAWKSFFHQMQPGDWPTNEPLLGASLDWINWIKESLKSALGFQMPFDGVNTSAPFDYGSFGYNMWRHLDELEDKAHHVASKNDDKYTYLSRKNKGNSVLTPEGTNVAAGNLPQSLQGTGAILTIYNGLDEDTLAAFVYEMWVTWLTSKASAYLCLWSLTPDTNEHFGYVPNQGWLNDDNFNDKTGGPYEYWGEEWDGNLAALYEFQDKMIKKYGNFWQPLTWEDVFGSPRLQGQFAFEAGSAFVPSLGGASSWTFTELGGNYVPAVYVEGQGQASTTYEYDAEAAYLSANNLQPPEADPDYMKKWVSGFWPGTSYWDYFEGGAGVQLFQNYDENFYEEGGFASSAPQYIGANLIVIDSYQGAAGVTTVRAQTEVNRQLAIYMKLMLSYLEDPKQSEAFDMDAQSYIDILGMKKDSFAPSTIASFFQNQLQDSDWFEFLYPTSTLDPLVYKNFDNYTMDGEEYQLNDGKPIIVTTHKYERNELINTVLQNATLSGWDALSDVYRMARRENAFIKYTTSLLKSYANNIDAAANNFNTQITTGVPELNGANVSGDFIGGEVGLFPSTPEAGGGNLKLSLQTLKTSHPELHRYYVSKFAAITTHQANLICKRTRELESIAVRPGMLPPGSVLNYGDWAGYSPYDIDLKLLRNMFGENGLFPAFQGKESANLRVMCIGIPAGMLSSLQRTQQNIDATDIDFKEIPYRRSNSTIVQVQVHRKDHARSSLVFEPLVYLFDMNMFLIDSQLPAIKWFDTPTGGVTALSPKNFDEILENTRFTRYLTVPMTQPTSDFTFAGGSPNFVNNFGGVSGTGLGNNLLNNPTGTSMYQKDFLFQQYWDMLSSTNKQSLLKNHIVSELLGRYYRSMYGMELDEMTYTHAYDDFSNGLNVTTDAVAFLTQVAKGNALPAPGEQGTPKDFANMVSTGEIFPSTLMAHPFSTAVYIPSIPAALAGENHKGAGSNADPEYPGVSPEWNSVVDKSKLLHPVKLANHNVLGPATNLTTAKFDNIKLMLSSAAFQSTNLFSQATSMKIFDRVFAIPVDVDRFIIRESQNDPDVITSYVTDGIIENVKNVLIDDTIAVSAYESIYPDETIYVYKHSQFGAGQDNLLADQYFVTISLVEKDKVEQIHQNPMWGI